MAGKNKSHQSYPPIVLGMPDIQKQLLLIDRLIEKAGEMEKKPLEDLALFLSELYSQLQHQTRVTIHRFGNKNRSSAG